MFSLDPSDAALEETSTGDSEVTGSEQHLGIVFEHGFRILGFYLV